MEEARGRELAIRSTRRAIADDRRDRAGVRVDRDDAMPRRIRDPELRTLGVERRHWDMAFTNAALAFDYPASAYTLMGIVGVSGMVAILGGAMYILVTVVSVFFGKPVESESSFGFSSTKLRRAEPVFVPGFNTT